MRIVTDLGPRNVMFPPITNRDPGDENDAVGRRIAELHVLRGRDQSVPCPMCLGDDGTQYGCEFCPMAAYPIRPTLPLFESGKPELATEVSEMFGSGDAA